MTGGGALEEEDGARRSEACGSFEEVGRSREDAQAGSAGQANVQRWELVARTKDAPRREGEDCYCSPSFATKTVGLAC